MDGSSASRPRLSIAVVGTGRVGSVLGAALRRSGHDVVGAYAVSAESRRRAAELLPGVAVSPVIEDVVRDAALVLLAVPDDALPGLVRGLAGRDVLRRGAFVAHTSGAHGLAVLEPLTSFGMLGLALHPAMTLAGTSSDLPRLAGCPFGVTASEELLPVAEALVVEMGGEPVRVPEEQRSLYHAALAVGANHLVTLVNAAADALGRAGIERPARLLGPLLGAALDNALRYGDAGLTGPVVRGDVGTVAEHLRVLGDRAPEQLEAYVALARLTARRARDAGRLPADSAAALSDVLGGAA